MFIKAEKSLIKPSAEDWLCEAKKDKDAGQIGMYLVHNGVVRATSKEEMYNENAEKKQVTSMDFSADIKKAIAVLEEEAKLPGVYYLRAWLAEGKLKVGDSIMQVLVGADTRTHCVDALQKVVGRLKSECVLEKEIYK